MVSDLRQVYLANVHITILGFIFIAQTFYASDAFYNSEPWHIGRCVHRHKAPQEIIHAPLTPIMTHNSSERE